LQLIVGRLEDFASKVTGSIDTMEFEAQRNLIRMLVKRIEIDQEHVNIVFRVAPPATSGPLGSENMHYCWRGDDCALRRATGRCPALSILHDILPE
jgi:site-specific DNA recombinase